MSKDDLVLISAFTGYVMVPTGQFGLVHKKCEEALGVPILTHMLASEKLHERIREALMPEVEQLIVRVFGTSDRVDNPPGNDSERPGCVNRPKEIRGIEHEQ